MLELFVALHDFAHIVNGGNELREVVGSEDKGQDVVTPALFHRAHAGAVFFKLDVFAILCGVDFLPLVLDQDFVLPDLLIDDLKLLLGKPVLLHKGDHLFENVRLLLFQTVNALLDLLYLTAELALPAHPSHPRAR